MNTRTSESEHFFWGMVECKMCAHCGRVIGTSQRITCDQCEGYGHPQDDQTARCPRCEGLGELSQMFLPCPCMEQRWDEEEGR